MKLATLWGHDETVAKFVADRAPIERPIFTEGDRAIGILRGDGALIAGVVFSQWRPQFRTVELSAAAVSSYCLNAEIVLELGGYAFGKLEAYRVFARTAARNDRARRLLRHIGFLEEAIQGHHYGPGVHATCWRLLEPEWREKWLMQEAA